MKAVQKSKQLIMSDFSLVFALQAPRRPGNNTRYFCLFAESSPKSHAVDAVAIAVCLSVSTVGTRLLPGVPVLPSRALCLGTAPSPSLPFTLLPDP